MEAGNEPVSRVRIACLLVPDLPLVAELRAHPELIGKPVAIASASDPRAEVVAVSPEAARAGVRPLSSVVHCRALCAELRVRTASPALESTARSALRDVALSASPRVEVAPRGSGIHAAEAAVYLDASGIRRLFPSETGFASALVHRAAKLGLPARVAVAASRGVAHLAARCPSLEGREDEVSVIPPGADASFLAPLPLDLLAVEDALAGSLYRLGIRRVGELAQLPLHSLGTRLGPPALRLRALARGEADELPLSPVRDSRCEEAIDLELPVDRLQPLAFVLRGLLSRLMARLDARGLGCGDLELSLVLLGGGREVRRLGLAAPTLDVKVLLRRILLSLESRNPPAPVESVTVATCGQPLRRDQLDLFRPSGPAPAVLEGLLAELEVLCGEGRVGAPRVLDDLRPNVFGVVPFTPTSGSTAESPEDRPMLAIRALRPPLPAQVRAPRGRPEWIRSSLANGRAVRIAGPWRTTGAWWSRARRFAYDHFDVQTEDGLVIRLRLDLIHSRWHIDAVYD
jgi:protein ImuB